jgi:hypothetical protein
VAPIRAIVTDFVAWVVRCRTWELSIDAIKELAPSWQLLTRGLRDECIDLAELDYVARERVRSPDANRAVPLLLSDLVAGMCDDYRATVAWVLLLLHIYSTVVTTMSMNRHRPRKQRAS